MAKKENIFKRFERVWKVLGKPDYDDKLSPEDEEKLKALNSDTKGFREEMVAKVKPVDINDIIPEPQQEKNLEREDRE